MNFLPLIIRYRINRIRLEFKDAYLKTLPIFEGVLIESDWNLKFAILDEAFRSL